VPASPSLAVVVVCHDSADVVTPTLVAVESQLAESDELVVVDNASTDGTVRTVRSKTPSARVIPCDANLGFGGGCARGAAETSAPLLLFLNPDAVAAPGSLDQLRAAAADHPHWGAWQALVTLPGGTHVNTAGNPVHFLGFAWAGDHDRSVTNFDGPPREVASASGAALVVRRHAWEAVGGFDERYFLYGEDVDLSLRLRLDGWAIGLVPSARVAHDYDFVKGDYKWFYLERNRWWTILGSYPGALLALLAPALILFELVLVAAAWRGGWLRPKLRALAAVLLALPTLVRRRRSIQARRTLSVAAFADVLTDSLDSPYLPPIPATLTKLQSAYWRAVKALV
jgi:N-acetylglucosaminyl-diphospho-decaprenol L-rhamnosyltransferase